MIHIGDDYRHDRSHGSPKGQSQIGATPWKIAGVLLLGVASIVAVVQGGRALLLHLGSSVEVEGRHK